MPGRTTPIRIALAAIGGAMSVAASIRVLALVQRRWDHAVGPLKRWPGRPSGEIVGSFRLGWLLVSRTSLGQIV